MARIEGFHSPKDYLELARSPSATADQLRLLADGRHGFVTAAVAEHRNTPPDVLANLLPSEINTYNDAEIVAALVENPHTPLEALTHVPDLILPRLHVRDDPLSFAAGVALASRADVPQEMLFGLLADDRATTEFRKVVARETTSRAVRERLLADRSERVRRAAQRNPKPDLP